MRLAVSLEGHFLAASLGALRVPISLPRPGRSAAFSPMRLAAQAVVRSLPGS